jgi:hypothetical protein
MKNLTRNNVILLVCLVALIILAPLFGMRNSLFGAILLTAIFFSGIFSLDFSAKSLKILLPLGTLTAATTWLGRMVNYNVVYMVDNLTTFLFLVAIVALMVRHIALSRNVTPTIILSSINGYLLLGVLGSVLLAIAEKVHVEFAAGGSPGIQFPGTTPPNFSDFIYFSFVTLSTLGYGDITPVSHLSRSLTILIAVAGQMYVTILIAMLVGKYLSGYKG